MIELKKVVLFTMVVFILTGLLAGCGSKSSNDTEKNPNSAQKQEDFLLSVSKNDSLAALLPDNIKSSGKIMIGLDDSYPPMEYRDDKNNLVGFDIDLGNAIGKKLGVNIEWVPTAWDGILPALKAKKFDMILSALSITDERKKEIAFSEPYISGGPIIITKKENSSVSGVDAIKGKVVGVQLGSTGEVATEKTGVTKEIKKYDKITEAFMDLAAGRIDALVADDQVGRYYMGLEEGKYVSPGKLMEEPFGIGFRKEDEKLKEAVQKAIDELKADGTLSKISLKWFKTDYYSK
ncbi:amino acid ABC transporter substrate-binding protein [Caloramator sp. E03]|nr:amino acid ABC transporter substrate-binding protein [Caloramator sp. E03]